MKKILLLPIFFSHLIFCAEVNNSLNLDTKEGQERWNKLIGLINSEIKTINQNRYSGPELKHRLFELYSEKIKLIKEKENLLMLKANSEDVIKNGKDFYFKHSKEQFNTAQKYAATLIAQYPKYNRINEIYYAMAINSRDYSNNKDTEQFLRLAIAQSKETDKVMYFSKTALAEYFYNEKKYHDAVIYYNDVLKNKDSEWYGKHLYNSAWCHLKERNFKRSLELMLQSYETTKDKKYVSMKEQIHSAIGIFFVQADKTLDGIDFFKNNTNPSSPHLLNLAKSSMDKNNFDVTKEVLNAALDDTKKRKDSNQEMKVRLTELDIYRENKKDNLYFETANNILELHKKNTLDKDDILLATNKLKEVAGFMQISLVKDKNAEVITYNKDDYKKIIRYFDILSVLDRKNKNQYRYYQGETSLSIHEYKEALKFYTLSIVNSKKNHDNSELNKKTLEAMLATIEIAKLPKNKENEYLIFTYKNYLLIYPQSDKSQIIYQKLFNKYYELKKTKRALNVLKAYIFFYKDDQKIHREMLTLILDFYIKNKDTNKLAFWINTLEKGYLNFEATYIQKSIAILGSLLFEKYQNLEKIGNKKEARAGYISIFENKIYPKQTKAEAAYAIAVLDVDRNKAIDSAKWLNESLSLYDEKELQKITPSLLSLSKEYRLLQRFDISSDITNKVNNKFCNIEFSSKNDFFEVGYENIIYSKLSNKEISNYEKSTADCHISDTQKETLQIMALNQFILNNDFEGSVAFYNNHLNNRKLQNRIGRFLKFKFYEMLGANKQDLDIIQTKIKSLSEKYPELNLNESINHYNEINEFITKIDHLKFEFSKEEKFNEDKYNSELEQYFSMIAALQKEATLLSKKAIPEEVILIRKNISRPYFSLAEAIKFFTPNGVDSKYLEGFNQGMRQIIESLNAKGAQLDHEKTAYLDKNNFFFEVQKYVTVDKKNERIEDYLSAHQANLFSNTIDLNRGILKK